MKSSEIIEKAIMLLDEYKFKEARIFLNKQGYSEVRINALIDRWDRGELKNLRHFNPKDAQEIPSRRNSEEYRPY